MKTEIKTKTVVAVALVTLSLGSIALALFILPSRNISSPSPLIHQSSSVAVGQNQPAAVVSSGEVNTSCNIDSGATGGQNAKYHATFTAYGKMENGVKKTKVVSTGQVYTMVGLNSNGVAVYKLINTTCDSGYVSGKAQCNYSVANVAGQGPVGTATGEIVDNEAGATTKNLLINVAIGTDSEQRPYNKCTKYTALTGLISSPSPVPVPTPTPGKGLYGEKSFTLASNYQATGGSNGTPQTANVKMVGKYLDNSYQVFLVVSGKYAIYGWDGKAMSWALADMTCNTGIITSTSTDDLGATVGGPAECNFSTNVGSGKLSAKIRTVNGAKQLIFSGVVYSKLQNGTQTAKLLPTYSVAMTVQ